MENAVCLIGAFSDIKIWRLSDTIILTQKSESKPTWFLTGVTNPLVRQSTVAGSLLMSTKLSDGFIVVFFILKVFICFLNSVFV